RRRVLDSAAFRLSAETEPFADGKGARCTGQGHFCERNGTRTGGSGQALRALADAVPQYGRPLRSGLRFERLSDFTRAMVAPDSRNQRTLSRQGGPFVPGAGTGGVRTAAFREMRWPWQLLPRSDHTGQ